MNSLLDSPSFDSYRNELSRTLAKISENDLDQAVHMIQNAWKAGQQILTCGNGGSASTASHYITDWGKMAYLATDKPFHGHCLSDNIGMFSAYGNDNGYDQVFSLALENYGRPDDLLIVVSGSGNSPNVVKALQSARERGLKTLAVCGFDGGKVRELADHSVWVPSNDMQICEDCHLVFGHYVMKTLTTEPLAVADS